MKEFAARHKLTKQTSWLLFRLCKVAREQFAHVVHDLSSFELEVCFYGIQDHERTSQVLRKYFGPKDQETQLSRQVFI